MLTRANQAFLLLYSNSAIKNTYRKPYVVSEANIFLKFVDQCYLVNEFNTLKYPKFKIFVKLLILRYQFIGITLSKAHLVCTFYNTQINAKKYEWKFGSVQIIMARQCIY